MPENDTRKTVAMIFGFLGTVSLAVMVYQGFSWGMLILTAVLYIIARALYPTPKAQ